MILRDIVNRDLYNLKNCDEEPIHIPGSIQPHGFLVAIAKATGQVCYCSENISLYLGVSYAQVLGKNIAEIFDNSFLKEIDEVWIADDAGLTVIRKSIKERLFLVSIHDNGDNIIIECEPVDEEDSGNDLFASSKRLLGYIEDSYTLRQLCNVVANAVKEISGYDRVMIYRFDNDYNGEVFAESKEEHLESFLGLHYPHTDIPVQARELYIKNQMRIIGDVSYTPVPIYTVGTGDNKSLDLSLSVLRSVSPIHLQYLQNMGVSATLTISLLHKGKLWGLIACHHYSPKYISNGVRLAAKLHGHFITSQVDVRILNEEYENAEKANHACNEITSMPLRLDDDSLKNIVSQDSMLRVCNAVGVSLLIDNTVYTKGQTPKENNIRKLSSFLARYTDYKSFHTDALAGIDAKADAIAEEFPGINYMCFSYGSPDCIIWYREETVKEVNWAGDPAKAIEKDKNGLSPRKSFMLWKEVIKGRSKPWLFFEINASRSLFNFLQNHLRSMFLYREQEKQKEIARLLQETNTELDNISWMSTHDLQEPLRKIRMMSSIILADDRETTREQINAFVSKMDRSAERMQVLIHDILEYSKLNGNTEFEQVDLNVLLAELKNEMADAIKEKNATVLVGELPVIKGVPLLLKQLFLNLVRNSFKFAEPGRDLEIKIETASLEEDSDILIEDAVIIKYSDNGIGFDNKYRESIFNAFSRLHNKDKYPGSGVGLALCKKIMLKHHGRIKAEGEEGKGAVFYLHFGVDMFSTKGKAGTLP